MIIIIGTLGHIVIYAAYKMQDAVDDAIVSHQLIHGKARFDVVARKSGSRFPEENWKMRFLVLASVYLYDIAIIVVCLFVDWHSIETNLPGIGNTGKYPCTPATYNKNFSVPTALSLNDFLQGDVDYALIYHYGIPLTDGIVGGYGGWPLYNPRVSKFDIQSEDSPLFAVKSRCTLPTAIDKSIFNHTINDTYYRIGETIDLPGIYSTTIWVAYQGGSHDTVPLDQPIQQACNVNVVSGRGEIRTEFNVDEWEMIVLGPIRHIKVPYKKNNLTAFSGKELNFDHFDDAFHKLPSFYDLHNFTIWYQKAIEFVFDKTRYTSSQSALFANIASWGTDPDGTYHTHDTWKGVAAAVAATCHFVLMQVF